LIVARPTNEIFTKGLKQLETVRIRIIFLKKLIGFNAFLNLRADYFSNKVTPK